MRTLLIGVACLSMCACVSMESQTFSSDPLVRPGAKIELGTVTIPQEKSYEIDAAALMQEALRASLSERGIIWEDELDADRFLLNVVVSDYEPGNAFGRWLMPGMGSTILHVTGQLIDQSSGESAGTLDYEKGVYAGGGYTIGAWKTIFATVADDIATELENRIEGKGFTVKLVPWSARDIDIPPAESPQQFKIVEVVDSREERGRIGERFAAFRVSMGDIFFSPSVPTFIEETFADELRGAGHQVNVDDSGRPVNIDIVSFWTHTDTTALYWDVIANMEVAVASAADSDQNLRRATFECTASKRTYVWPSLELVTGVMDECLISLMSDVRSDPIWQSEQRH